MTFTEKAFFGEARFIQEADFSGATFTQGANFGRAMFSDWANFWMARFIQEAIFPGVIFIQGASFGRTTFTQGAVFWGAKFTQEANFREATFRGTNFGRATFSEGFDLTLSVFGPRKDDPPEKQDGEPAAADFHGATFLKPEMVRFLRVNEEGRQGFRAGFVDCLIKGVLFEDVHWHKEDGRMVLQDELDRLANALGAASYEQVATTYRRLINNFEEARAYDLAEDCAIGLMEMKRLDPERFLFARWLKAYYEQWYWLRWLGERLSVAYLYRFASKYGTSYRWALGVLVGIVVAFALLFSFSVVAHGLDKEISEVGPVVGLFHSLEVATFYSNPRYTAANGLAWGLEIAERILIPAQLSLFLLALRRRFRR